MEKQQFATRLYAVIFFSALFAVIKSEVIKPIPSLWRAYVKHVITYESTTPASSEMVCVRECIKCSQCDSCAYERESGTCYLHVETDTAPDDTVNTVTRSTGKS